MWPDRVSNPGHLALESDVLPTALCGLAHIGVKKSHQDFILPRYKAHWLVIP